MRRLELGMTQMELAEKVGYTTTAALCRIEKGTNNLRQITHEKAPKPPDFSALDKLSSMPLKSIYGGFSNAEKRYFWRSFIRRIEYGRDKSIRVVFL